MDNLNNIPSTGNFGDVADKLNDNFNKVNIAVETINSKYVRNKGYFPTLAALQTAFPSPKNGDTAYVANEASSSGYYVANVVSGAWVETTTVAPAMAVNANEYAKHGYSATPKTLKQVDDSKAESGGSPKTLKEVDNKIAEVESDVEQLAGDVKILETPFDISNNLADKSKIVAGTYLNTDTNINVSVNWISILIDNVVSGLQYTVSGIGATGVSIERFKFYNSAGAFLSGLNSNGLTSQTIVIPENATKVAITIVNSAGIGNNPTDNQYANSIQFESGDSVTPYTPFGNVQLKKTQVDNLTFNELTTISKKLPLAINELEGIINKMSPMLLSLRNDVGETSEELSRTIFPSNMYLSNIGDYIEAKCSCPEYVSANAANISMFLGSLTNGGLYSNSFYFRSSLAGAGDYRIWAFPVGFDPKILHTYKLQIVDDGAGGELWELFVDGLSWGTKEYSTNANIDRLNGNTAASSAVRYDYEYVKVKSIGEEKHFTASELFLLSENAKMLPALAFESIFQEQKEQNTRLDVVENIAEDANSMVKNLGNIYATDLYYSSYNRKFESDGIKSSTYFDKPYLIESEGDYIEIKARYYGDIETYHDKLSLVSSGMGSRFGWQTLSSFMFRAYSGHSNLYWHMGSSEVNIFDWNVYRLEVVSGGVELFLNGVSKGFKPSSLTGYEITGIVGVNLYPGYADKYDVKYFKASSQRDGEINIDTPAIYGGSENVELLMSEEKDSEEEDGVFTPNPLCFVSYNDSAKTFNVYIRDEEDQNIYYGFLIGLQTTRGTPDDPIGYSHLWRLYSGAIYTYNKQMNVMTPTGITTVTAGESECVFMHTDPNGTKVDHTGGVHGDETIDVTIGDFAKFYLDGVPLTELELSESFTMRACSEFKYIQKSSIHETAYYEDNVDTELAATGAGDLTLKSDTGTFAIDGIDTGIPAYATNTVFASTQAIIDAGITLSVSGANTWVLSRVRRVYNDHPIIASHLKKSVMKGQKFHTENTLIFNNTRDLEYWYAGIYCLGKGVATIGHNGDYEDVEFTGSGNSFLAKNDDDYRLFEAYNPITGGSAIVKNWITDEGGVLDDNNCDMFIWDRAADSKYYRRVNSFAPIIGERMTAVTEVEYNKRSD